VDQQDKPKHYAKVHFRGTLSANGTNSWQVQIGAKPSGLGENLPWRLNLRDKNELNLFAREHEGKVVVVAGTITADRQGYPTVNVEAMKQAP
jgi:hypothetical protein